MFVRNHPRHRNIPLLIKRYWLNLVYLVPSGLVREESIALIADILGEGSYTRLKEQRIKCLSINESTKLRHLLTHLVLGDRD